MSYIQFTAIGLVFLAVAFVVALSVHGYETAVGDIFGRFYMHPGITAGTPAADLEVLSTAAREGARWAQGAKSEATTWAVVLIVVGIALVFYHALWTPVRALRGGR